MENNGTVLIVDDQPSNVKLLTAFLTTAGYDIVKAYSSEEALDLARTTLPDVILLDVMMPGMDGYTVASILKNDQRMKDIPVVLVTALEEIDDKVKGLEAGADDFLAKPVNRTELLARVRSLIKLKRLQEDLAKKVQLLNLMPGGVPPASPVTIPRKKVILIIEDDEKQLKTFRVILGSAGYATLTAASSTDALTLLDEAVPDLILLDIFLGEVNGFDLLSMLKGNPKTADIPVIIVSALGDLETKVKGIETGAEDYFVKPISTMEMLARIKANLRKHETSQKLKSCLNAIFTQTITDHLTGLYNRQYVDLVLENELASVKRYNRTTTLLLCDIDHFKTINDTFGHPAGDSVLKGLGHIFARELRGSDIACRYGGDEFTVILPETDYQGGCVVAERLRTRVEEHPFPQVDGRIVTISIGLAEIQPEDGDRDAVIKRADDALYRAKRGGRNRIEAHLSEPESIDGDDATAYRKLELVVNGEIYETHDA